VAASVVAIVAISARFATIGADARWLAALGRVIATRHSVPTGVPFAGAPSAHFPNVLALSELIFYGLEHAMGERGLMVAQLLAVAIAMVALGQDALAGGASSGGVAGALGLVMVGVLPSLAIARVQLFSLALFPVLLALLRSETRSPSRRIWLLVPMLALWSNLHGAVLIGFGVACCYLLLERTRCQPVVALLVAVSAALALCVTPALIETISYYHRGLTNVGVQRGLGAWSSLSLSHPLDDVLLVASAVLALGLARGRRAPWEYIAALGLGMATVEAGRNGIWLLFFLAAPGAHVLRFGRRWDRLLAPALVVGIGLIAYSIVHGPAPSGADRATVARAIRLADGTPVLAPDIVAEQVALAGGRIWLSNPLEAFSPAEQAMYLDWVQGLPSGAEVLSGGVRVVLVTRGTDTERLMNREPAFAPIGADRTTITYLRDGMSATRSQDSSRTP
jgi:hypothetical protein